MQGEDGLEGLEGTSIVDAFDFITETWDTTIASLDTPRVYATAVALDDSIYVMGGVDNHGKILNSVEVYDPVKNQWHYAPSMLDRRKGAAAVVYGDSILVFGGGGELGLHHTVEVYSPASGLWSMADTLIWARAFHHVVKIGKYIYIIGGLGELGPYRFIERYNPANGSTQIGLTWSNPRAFFDVILKNDSVFAISGYGSTSSDGYYGDIDLLDFQTLGAEAESEAQISLSLPRAGFIADTGEDGRVYIFGGFSPDYKEGQFPVPSVEVISHLALDRPSVVESDNANPKDFSLSQNYPNPFNPTTTIEFQVLLPDARVRLEVFNMLGQRVSTLVDGLLKGGNYSVVFAGENLPSGAYIYRLQGENGIIYRKMVLIK